MRKLPYMASREALPFPGTISPIYIGREKSLKALEAAINGDNRLFISKQKNRMEDSPAVPAGVEAVGVEVAVLQTAKTTDGSFKVLIEVMGRINLGEFSEENGVLCVTGEEREKKDVTFELGEAISRNLTASFIKYNETGTKDLSKEILSIGDLPNLEQRVDAMASHIIMRPNEAQDLIEEQDVEKRAYKLLELIEREIAISSVEDDIETKVKKKMSKAQRDYYLREKLAVVKAEMGDDPEEEDEIEELNNKVEKSKMGKELKTKLKKEIKKLEKMPALSSEASVVRSYIDTVTSLPWKKKSKDLLDITFAEAKLNEDHYGLDDIKEHILDYLAIKTLNGKMKGNIICLVGPPGVGKTSLAKSVADAMKKKFARISLGGVRDEAEIRGHRRTYIGAMPGKIIKAIKSAGTSNPLILLDEIDKMSNDVKGDPSSAMLEVLDPEQNSNFEDHYIDSPFDLSDVFFIATANDIRRVPGPLRDRMEIIELTSYTEYEKVHIAKKYLIPEAQKNNGLDKIKVNISDEATMMIINEYTLEAGVRNLKREINRLFRKLGRKYLAKPTKSMTVSVKNVEKYLGKIKFRPDKLKEKTPKVGIVNGLAWTSAGGVAMDVQALVTPGKGKVLLTGKLGDVMKESAQVAYSYIRGNTKKYKVKENFNEVSDVHLHFPEGGIPKDGPSAGIAITTALISATSGKPVRQDIAMTGEITITGDVLPIGGVKEKVIGAHRIGVDEVILPYDNGADVADLPAEIKSLIKVHLVKTYDEVAKIVFAK